MKRLRDVLPVIVIAAMLAACSSSADAQAVQWTPVTAPSRRAHALAYDAARGATVLFGGAGFGGAANFGDTWEWNGIAWMLRATSGPTARSAHAMAYDAARGVTVLFGGNANGFIADDTWEWNGNTWTQRFFVSGLPS